MAKGTGGATRKRRGPAGMGPAVPAALQVEMYRRMLRIRRFEEEVCRRFEAGEVVGALHTSIGQEAAAVGACLALEPGDTMTGTHRSHGHPIAKGSPLGPLMAELMGRREGICRGKGGSMHLADFAVGSLGETGIVGAGLPIATGAALSSVVRNIDRVTVCFFGDGATNEGSFHESLNMASIWKLPVIYFCENNLYAATTAAADTHAVKRVADRASAYAIPATVVDGQDVVAVHEAVRAAAARARAGGGPELVEALTYRYLEHAVGYPIPSGYRREEEIARWRERDPIALFRARLLAGASLDETGVGRIEREVEDEVSAAVEFARAGAVPSPAEAFDHVFATPVDAGAPRAPVPEGGREITYFNAFVEAVREELLRDPSVIYMGEDLAFYETGGLISGVGPRRIWSTPISENGFAGMAVGAAMTGLRPIVDLTIANFAYVAFDAIVNQAARMRYMSGGQTSVPVVYRAAMWHNHSIAAHHSDRPYPLFMHMPGLKVVVPATPYDVKGLLKAAVRDDDPVLLFDDLGLWFDAGPVPEEDYVVPLGRAALRRAGRDATIVVIGSALREALAAAEALALAGIEAEVLDLRSLVPLDLEAILASIARTRHLVVADPANRTAGAAAEILARVIEEGFDLLRRPPVRVTTPDTHIPFSPAMERPLYPNRERIAAAVRGLVGA